MRKKDRIELSKIYDELNDIVMRLGNYDYCIENEMGEEVSIYSISDSLYNAQSGLSDMCNS